MTMTMETTMIVLAMFFLSIVSPQTTYVQAQPSGFIAEPVSSTYAIAGTFMPNPRSPAEDDNKQMIILVEKTGKVRVIEDPDNNSKSIEVLDLDGKMCLDTERGLQTVAIHPNFNENRWVYLYYNVFKEGCLADDSLDGPWNVIARFEMDPETLMLNYNKREEVWRGAPLYDAVHNGGGMVFGNDGKLWIAVGESGEPELSPLMGITHGKLIRLNDDGTTPDDNPYTKKNGYEAYHCGTDKLEGMVPKDASEDAVCSEIWASGLRNPFRMSLDPNEKEKTRLIISDVGAKTWEEINYGGTDYPMANYGYDEYEGPCKRHSTVDCAVPADYLDPFHYYLHRPGDNGGCVAANAIVPNGIGWPEEYNFLFIDYVYLNIYSLIEDEEQGCRDCLPPVSSFRNESFYESIPIPGEHKNEARMLDMFFGPYKDTQALYVIRFGRYDNVFRIRYTGIANEPPDVVFSFKDRLYEEGEIVQFDASGTKDTEGDELIYDWYFGDGATSNEISPSHSYESPGQYKVTLIVRDVIGQAQQKSETVVVGTPPTANIISPEEGQQFAVGDIIRLKGEAFYENGTAFNDDQLLWEVRKHHAEHWHPFLSPSEGNDFDLQPGPEPEDLYASTNSYLEIILFAIDENGLTGEVNRLVEPMMVSVGIDSSPPGRTIIVDAEPTTAFEEVLSWQNHELKLEVEDQPPFMFQQWSDGETSRERTEILNTTSSLFTAFFCVDDGGSCDGDSAVCCEGRCNGVGICGEVGDVNATTPVPTEQQVVDDSLGDIDLPSVSVTDPEVPSISEPESPVTRESDESLSAGAKVGISVATIGVVAALIVFFVWRRSKSGGKTSGSINTDETMESPSQDAADEPTPVTENKTIVDGEVAEEAPPPTVGVEAAIL
eukprot:CAMPEP_0113490068 /NCGR_PEP_ID=MMETSP0014_2-20120614/26853_1 /TAXON_ID=2857 /ORGANISM="Nitzschia sp." /LENGTH=886 /DNA_ID=CAMNT_0000383823 /DNA_START=218 /DNA_END=2878 /DNA_ORIENTATION=+ /assembly_acc=CAM_ASM_000159